MPDGDRAGRQPNSYNARVIELLMERQYTAGEIATAIGNPCTANYVRYVANMVGLQPLAVADRRRLKIDARRACARLLEDAYRRQQQRWGFT